MSEEKDNLKSIKVYKFSNTKERWHEFSLEFRVKADSSGYEEIIYGTKTPPDEKEELEILEKDDADTRKLKKEKLAARLANKKEYRVLVMSTEGISLNIVENATSEKLIKGDLKKAWDRLKRQWNPKTREDKVEVYTKFLNYRLENVRETNGLDGLHGEITHLLNSFIKDKLRKGEVDLPEIEQILEDKYQSMKNVKGWDEGEDNYALYTNHSNEKKYKKQFKGRCAYCGEYGQKPADCPIKKSNQNKVFRGKSDQKKKHSTKGEYKGKGHKDMSKIKCYTCREYGHYACDCPNPCDNANIAQENEQNKGFKNMMDLD